MLGEPLCSRMTGRVSSLRLVREGSSLDHVRPWGDSGGRTEVQIFRFFCKACNCGKGTEYEDYRHRRGFLRQSPVRRPRADLNPVQLLWSSQRSCRKSSPARLKSASSTSHSAI